MADTTVLGQVEAFERTVPVSAAACADSLQIKTEVHGGPYAGGVTRHAECAVTLPEAAKEVLFSKSTLTVSSGGVSFQGTASGYSIRVPLPAPGFRDDKDQAKSNAVAQVEKFVKDSLAGSKYTATALRVKP